MYSKQLIIEQENRAKYLLMVLIFLGCAFPLFSHTARLPTDPAPPGHHDLIMARGAFGGVPTGHRTAQSRIRDRRAIRRRRRDIRYLPDEGYDAVWELMHRHAIS
jgi:hypothetical protein